MSSYIIEVASVWRADSSPYSLQQNEIVPILSMQTSKAISDKNINCTELNMFCIGFSFQICSCITAITKINTTVVALAKFVIRMRPTSVFILGGTIFASFLSLGAFTYDVRFLGWQVGQAASDFTKQTYVVKYLIRAGQKYPQNI